MYNVYIFYRRINYDRTKRRNLFSLLKSSAWVDNGPKYGAGCFLPETQLGKVTSLELFKDQLNTGEIYMIVFKTLTNSSWICGGEDS